MPMTFERSPDTEAVVVTLRGVNDEIAYKSIAKQAELSLRRVMEVLHSARRILKKEKLLFGVIRGEGLRRLVDLDKAKLPEAFKRRASRGADREIKNLDTIDNFDALPQDVRHSVTTNRIILNTIRMQAKVKPEAPKPPKTTPQPMPDVGKITQLMKKA